MGLTPRRRSVRRLVTPSRRDRGQALAEFALVAPIMALILVSLVQFAFIFERQIGIENAVRDGARRAATYTTTAANASATAQAVWNAVFGTGGLMLSNVQGYDSNSPPVHNPEVCYRTTNDASGNPAVYVKVSVGYSHPLFLPLITQIIDGIDGSNDNALRIDTSSEFQVEDDFDTQTRATIGGGSLCYP